jgi:hypothetical protein
MSKHTNTFDSTPVVGERVTGHSDGPGYHSTWSGIYEGVRPSEWDGKLMHYMRDGEINGVRQSIFGHPVAQTSAPAPRILDASNVGAYLAANPAPEGWENG